MAAMYFALCQNLNLFLVKFAFENIENRTKMVLVTLIPLNTKTLMLIPYFPLYKSTF